MSDQPSLSDRLNMIRESARSTMLHVAELRLELGLDCGETFHQLGCNHPVPPLEELTYVSPAAPFYEKWKETHV